MLAHTWSLCIEEQFYVVFPLLVFLTPKRKIPLMCGIIIAAGIVFRISSVIFFDNIYMVSISPFSQIDLLACGVLLCCRQRDLITSKTLTQLIKHSLTIGIVGLAVVIAAVGALHDDVLGGYHLLSSPGNYQNNVFTAQIFFFLGLISVGIIDRCTLQEGMPAKILSTPLLRHLGKISYGLYVYHWPILLVARKISDDKLIITSLALVATYAVSVVSFYTMERFFTRQKRKFEYT
jgi:peptidoglycan/LPS O-acetylase OafA/YrhL